MSSQELTEAPVITSVINTGQIDEMGSFNVVELLTRQKGMDYIRSGVLGAGINVYGFNSAFNSTKNLQINDACLSTPIATGAPLGPLPSVAKKGVGDALRWCLHPRRHSAALMPITG